MVDFAGALGGLFTGLAQGAEVGISLGQKQQQIDLQRSQQGVGLLNAMVNMRRMPLEMRKIVMPGILKQYEKAFGAELPKTMYDLATKSDDDTWGKTVDALVTTLPKNAGYQELAQHLKQLDDPEAQLKALDLIRKMKSGESLTQFRTGTSTSTDLVYDEYGRVIGRRTTRGIIPVPGTVAPSSPSAAPEAPAMTAPPPKLGPTPSTPLGPLPNKTDDQKAAEVTGLLDTANRGPQFGTQGVPGRPPTPTTIPLEMDRAEAPTKPLGYRGDQTKTGPDYLATLPPGRADLIRQYGEYRRAPPEGRGTPNALQLNADIARAYPDYDAKNWVQYKKAITDFSAGGQAGKNVVSLTTAIGHMGTMFDLYQALNSGNVPAVNAVVNAARRATGDPNITNIDAARQALADELKRVFTVVGVGTEADRKGWFDILSSAKTPEQANGVLRTMSKLLESRVGALRKQWEDQGPPGRPMPGYPTGEAEAALRKIQATAPKSTTTPAAPGASAPMTATNPKTGQKIRSLDGGKTWQAVQ